MVCLLRRYDGTRYPHCGRVVSPCVGNVIVRASTAYFTSPNWASRDPKRGPKPHKWALTRRPRSQPGARSRFPRFPLLVVQGILRRSADFVLFLLRFVFPEFVRIFAVAGEFGEQRIDRRYVKRRNELFQLREQDGNKPGNGLLQLSTLANFVKSVPG